MLDQLLSLVKDLGQDQVVNNPDVPNELNDAVMANASASMLGTLQQALASGKGAELMGLFQQQDDAGIMSNPLAQQIQGGFMENITGKLGIDGKTASGLAASFIPMILNQLVKRTNSTAPEDSGFSLEGLIGNLTGAQQGGGGMDIGSLIGQFTGGGGQGGGGLSDIVSQFTGGGQKGDAAGGLGDLVKGFFGK